MIRVICQRKHQIHSILTFSPASLAYRNHLEGSTTARPMRVELSNTWWIIYATVAQLLLPLKHVLTKRSTRKSEDVWFEISWQYVNLTIASSLQSTSSRLDPLHTEARLQGAPSEVCRLPLGSEFALVSSRQPSCVLFS